MPRVQRLERVAHLRLKIGDEPIGFERQIQRLIGDAFLGWLVTDGYLAYRDHPRRQRCLAHLIRKGLALAVGDYGAGSAFGRDLVRDLRRLIERVHDGEGGKRPPSSG